MPATSKCRGHIGPTRQSGGSDLRGVVGASLLPATLGLIPSPAGGRDLFLYYTRGENGDDTITDFDGADDTILLDGFTAAAVEVRTEHGGTILVLAGRGRIVLRGVNRLDDDDLAFR